MDSDEILKQLQEQMQAFAKQLEEANKALAPLKDEQTKINSAEHQIKQEYNIRMNEIREKRRALDNEMFSAQSKANQAQQQLKSMELKAAQIKKQQEEEKAKKEALQKEVEQYKALGERFDNATMGAPWREWAKPHQIDAGHKITMDRNVILADPMGLGKTLSVIIVNDIAEKVTKEATPNTPFLGEEKQVLIPEDFIWTEKGVAALYNKEWPFENRDERVEYTFKEGQWHYRSHPVAIGASLGGFITYDQRNRWVVQGILEKIPAHYETKIVNAIDRPVGRKVLYICPSPLLRNVMEEYHRWAPHRNATYIGNMSRGEQNFVLDHVLPSLDQYVIILNYESWRRNTALLDKLIEKKFDTIVLDEAHNVKEMKTNAYKGVAKLIEGLKPEYIVPMTGTPILNKPQELFSLLHLVNPVDFNHERDFLFRYCEEYEDNNGRMRWKFREGGLEQLAKKISKNFMRRTREDAGIQLPDKTVIYHDLDRDDENYPMQAKARHHMKKYATLVLDEKSGKALQATVMIALITRLRQIETWPAGIKQIDKNTKEIILELGEKYAESQKIDYLVRYDNNSGDWEGLIPEVVEDERVVVFSQFKEPLRELQRRIEKSGKRAVILDGSTPDALRTEIRHDFDRKVTPNRADRKWDVLLANYKAGGVGLNLTNATQLITLDEEWNPGKRDQAWDRIHRIGQTEAVTVHVIRTKNTIDSWLADLIDQKENVVGGFEQAMIDFDELKKFLDDEDDTGGLA